jgi:hypothetical protein
MSYNTLIYREPGGNKEIVSSGGEIEVQSGGTLDIQAGATIVGEYLLRGVIPLDLFSAREIISNDIVVVADGAAQGSGGILAKDTTPTLLRVNGATDKAARLTWASSNSDEIQFSPVMIPPDFDPSIAITVHLLALAAGATDTPTFDVQVFEGVGDTEMGAATGAVSAALAELTATIPAAGLSGHPLGFLNICLVPGAHTTDALYLYGAWIEYTRKAP